MSSYRVLDVIVDLPTSKQLMVSVDWVKQGGYESSAAHVSNAEVIIRYETKRHATLSAALQRTAKILKKEGH
jgi:hypothetical protein